MADIAVCLNRKCPSFRSCYTAQAKVNEYRQAYMKFVPEPGKDKCFNYRPLLLDGVNLSGSIAN